MIQQYYYWEKLDTGPSWFLKGLSTKVWRSVTHEESEFSLSHARHKTEKIFLCSITRLSYDGNYISLSLSLRLGKKSES